jgi:hypothetical protein
MSNIHKALIAAMHDISRIGIAKTKVADQVGGAKYRFRGIEDAMNEMSPILVRHGITVTPHYSDLQIVERAKGEGKATRLVTVKGSFKFAAEDGSFVESEAYGEAMDSGDKATTKAQSVSFRTALFQQFVVPFMAMDPEDDDGNEGSEPDAQMLTEFQSAAMNGEAALRKHYEANVPTEAFWKKHGRSLKDAAKKADTDKVPA